MGGGGRGDVHVLLPARSTKKNPLTYKKAIWPVGAAQRREGSKSITSARHLHTRCNYRRSVAPFPYFFSLPLDLALNAL